MTAHPPPLAPSTPGWNALRHTAQPLPVPLDLASTQRPALGPGCLRHLAPLPPLPQPPAPLLPSPPCPITPHPLSPRNSPAPPCPSLSPLSPTALHQISLSLNRPSPCCPRCLAAPAALPSFPFPKPPQLLGPLMPKTPTPLTPARPLPSEPCPNPSHPFNPQPPVRPLAPHPLPHTRR